MWQAGWVALARFGEWPLWDPYHCGGITIWGNPQSQHLSPLYALAFVGGPTVGSKLFLLVHAAAGFGGMFAFARQGEGMGRVGALLASVAWASSGFFAWHGSGGHSAFLPFFLAPLVLLAWRRAADDPRWAAGVALLLALVLLEGGVYPFPYLTVLLVFDALVRLARRGRRGGIVVGGILAALLTALLGAVRVLPIADELRRHPRTMPGGDSLTPAEIIEMLTVRVHEGRRYGDHEFVWAEYGSYVGWGVVALGVLGVLLVLRRRQWALPLGLLWFGGLMLGDHGPLFPWPLLHELPIYDSLRVPSRFAVLFTFYLALAAGTAIDAVVRGLDRFTLRWPLHVLRRVVPLAVVLGIAYDINAVNEPTIDRWKRAPVATHPVAERHHLSTRNYARWYASLPRLGVGSARCYEAMTFEVARGLWNGDVPQARVEGGAGEVRTWGRTTSRAWAEVALTAPARVVFNQNWAPGWRASVGTARADARGRLVVDDVPMGTHRVALVYRPPTLVPALCLTGLGLLATLLVMRFATRTRLAAFGRRSLSAVGYRRG